MGIVSDDATILKIKHEVLTEVAKLAFAGELDEKKENIPYEMIPGPEAHFRCCIYKEREIIRQRVRLAEGKCPGNRESSNIVQVINSACEECPISSGYVVTDLCQGCLAKSCKQSCNFGAITIGNDRSYIDPEKCKSCGKCAQACSYSAIVKIQRPCMKSCPVSAITMDEHGVCQIDESKCIQCGQCIHNCPFGAIASKTSIVDIINAIREGKKVVAMLAPAGEGQFGENITMASWRTAMKKLGFADFVEVGLGGDMTAAFEAEEWAESFKEGKKMTTSCCPSYIELVEKHMTEMKPYVSTTGSPMYYAARIAKKKHPDAKIVFVGPCVAKRKEVRRDDAVDYILTFEEVGSILDGMDIQLEQVNSFSILHTSVREAHGFAQAGGVMGAVKAYLKEEADKINAIQVSDINKKNIALLRACAKTGKAAGQFIEVMACEGGCITGPSTHNDIVSGRRQLAQELLKRKESYETMDR